MEVLKNKKQLFIQKQLNRLTPQESKELANILNVHMNTYYKYRKIPNLIRVCDTQKILKYFHNVFGVEYTIEQLYKEIK